MEEHVSDWIERAVIESDRRRCAAKVSSISSENAVEKGDNYLSNLKRLTLDVVLNSGERQTRKLMFKAFPEGENRVKFAQKNGVFAREIRVFQDIIPEMEDILTSKDPTAEFLWPQFYSAQRRYEGLLMEDLSVKGFKMAFRRNGLDFDHSLWVVRSLAKFHALGAILRKRGDLRIKDFYPAVFNAESMKVPGFTKKLFNKFTNTVETEWEGDWVDCAQRLRTLGEKIDDLIEKEYMLDDSKFNTLNHGDCWVNNVLFRHDKYGKPDSLRFIDFQVANYNTPAFDLQYFFTTSLDFPARDRKKELIQEYQKRLSECLKLYGYPEDEIPSLETVMELYEGARYYGFYTAITALPFTIAKKEDAKSAEELDELSKQINEREEIDFDIIHGNDELLVKILQYVVKEGLNNGIL